MNTSVLGALALLVLSGWVGAAEAPPAPRQERVTFTKGQSSALIKGTLKGGADVDYRVRAAAGQTLTVTLQASHPQNAFNVLPPGSAGAAMFVSSMTGAKSWSGLLPADGDYAIRVYLMRPAARRNESSSYTLTVAVTGEPLLPLPAAQDARIAGTAYHATARLPCALPGRPDVSSCDAGVVRRGHDGTATVEIIGPAGVQRRILFRHGRPAAGDAMQSPSASRIGAVTTVVVDGERYEIPDAFLTGG